MGQILQLPPPRTRPSRSPQRVIRTVRIHADPIARPRALDVHRDPQSHLRSLVVTFLGEVLLLGGGALALRELQLPPFGPAPVAVQESAPAPNTPGPGAERTPLAAPATDPGMPGEDVVSESSRLPADRE